MPEQPPPIIHFSLTAQSGGRAVCGTLAPTDGTLAGVTAKVGMVTCFACRNSAAFKAERDKRDPVLIGKVLTEMGIGAPTPPITFEFEFDSHQLPLVPLLSAMEQIRRDNKQAAQYDIVEWRNRGEVGIHLWLWPTTRATYPTRVWILQDGTVDMDEDVDWLDDSEWPEHIK